MDREYQLSDHFSESATTLRVIVWSLSASVVALLGFALYSKGIPQPIQLDAPDMLTIISICMACSGTLIANVFCRLVVAEDMKTFDTKAKVEEVAQGLEQRYQVNTIVTCALLEAPGILGAFTFLNSGSLIGLGIAVVMVAGILTQTPSAGRMARWANDLWIRKEEEPNQDF